MTHTHMDLQSLPQEIVRFIIGQCPLESVLTLRQTSKTMQSIVHSMAPSDWRQSYQIPRHLCTRQRLNDYIQFASRWQHLSLLDQIVFTHIDAQDLASLGSLDGPQCIRHIGSIETITHLDDIGDYIHRARHLDLIVLGDHEHFGHARMVQQESTAGFQLPDSVESLSLSSGVWQNIDMHRLKDLHLSWMIVSKPIPSLRKLVLYNCLISNSAWACLEEVQTIDFRSPVIVSAYQWSVLSQFRGCLTIYNPVPQGYGFQAEQLHLKDHTSSGIIAHRAYNITITLNSQDLQHIEVIMPHAVQARIVHKMSCGFHHGGLYSLEHSGLRQLDISHHGSPNTQLRVQNCLALEKIHIISNSCVALGPNLPCLKHVSSSIYSNKPPIIHLDWSLCLDVFELVHSSIRWTEVCREFRCRNLWITNDSRRLTHSSWCLWKHNMLKYEELNVKRVHLRFKQKLVRAPHLQIIRVTQASISFINRMSLPCLTTLIMDHVTHECHLKHIPSLRHVQVFGPHRVYFHTLTKVQLPQLAFYE